MPTTGGRYTIPQMLKTGKNRALMAGDLARARREYPIPRMFMRSTSREASPAPVDEKGQEVTNNARTDQVGHGG